MGGGMNAEKLLSSTNFLKSGAEEGWRRSARPTV